MIIKLIKKDKIKKSKKIDGSIEEADILSPSYINTTNPNYMEVDGLYYSGLIVVNYFREYSDIILKPFIDYSEIINISIFYEKQDKYKVIRDLTYHIRKCWSRIKRYKRK